MARSRGEGQRCNVCCLIISLAFKPNLHNYVLLSLHTFCYILVVGVQHQLMYVISFPFVFPLLSGIHMGSSRSCGNLMDLAQVCDPSLISRDRNQEVNTEVRGDTQHHYLGVCARGKYLRFRAVKM